MDWMAVMACSAQLSFASRAPLPFSPKLFPVSCDPSTFAQLIIRHARVSFRVLAARHNTTSSSKSRKYDSPHNDVEEEDFKGDAFAVIKQLEKDLERGHLSDDGNEITEEDIGKFSKEVEEIAAEDTTEEVTKEVAYSDFVGDLVESVEEVCSKLKNWQLRRLATALKIGRRHVSVKRLAEDVCLDRAVVLDLLREPPPKLLMLSALVPDEPVASPVSTEGTQLREIPPVKARKKSSKDIVDTTRTPIYVLQNKWFEMKGLKKIQVQALEKIYKQTKYPNNKLIENLVHVLRARRNKVIKWFVEKRAADQVASHHTDSQFRA